MVGAYLNMHQDLQRVPEIYWHHFLECFRWRFDWKRPHKFDSVVEQAIHREVVCPNRIWKQCYAAVPNSLGEQDRGFENCGGDLQFTQKWWLLWYACQIRSSAGINNWNCWPCFRHQTCQFANRKSTPAQSLLLNCLEWPFLEWKFRSLFELLGTVPRRWYRRGDLWRSRGSVKPCVSQKQESMRILDGSRLYAKVGRIIEDPHR